MKFLFIIIILICSFASNAQYWTIDLNKGLLEAKDYSKKIAANKAEYEAALSRTKLSEADLMPQLFLDGQYKYIDEVSSVTLPAPISKTVMMGKNNNYSAGVNLSYLLTDFGQQAKVVQSSREEAQAQADNLDVSEANLILSVKNLFYKIQYQSNQMETLNDAWILAKNQEQDVSKRFKSGTSSRLDYINATKETLNYKLRLMQLARDFSGVLEDWCILTGEKHQDGLFLNPVVENMEKTFLEDKTVIIKVRGENLDSKVSSLNMNHPELLTFEHLKIAESLKKESYFRSYFPRISLNARSSLEYPHFNLDEHYHQNIFSLSLTMPLWDGGKRSEQMSLSENRIRSYELQKENLTNEFKGRIEKLKNSLGQIKKEIKIAQKGRENAEELAHLTFQSYQNGRSNYLEVESANLKVLDWKTQIDSLNYFKSLAATQLEYLGAKK